MLNNSDYKNKKVLVLGLAKSGVSAAKLLHRLGALVTVNDKQKFDDNKDAQALLDEGVTVITGSHPVELLDEGFSLMVKNPGIPYSNPMVVRAQQLGIPVITEPELAYSVSDSTWVGVTGSNGKTTTTTLIGLMLNERETAGHAYDAGNIGIPVTGVVQKAGAQDTVVCELSSFMLVGIQKLHPHIAVLTNIYEAHLDWHGSRENYVKAKMRITMNQTKDDFFIMNWDLPEMHELAKQSPATVVPFSRKGATGARATLTAGWLCFDGEQLMKADEMQIPGDHNIENALAAIAAAKLSGTPNAAIVDVLHRFTGVKHRIQYVETVAGRKVYNDSKATNVEASTVALNAFKQPIVLLAGGLDRHLPMDDLLPLIKQHVRAMVTFGETAPLMEALAKQAGIPFTRTDNVKTAVPIAFAASQPGDVILLSPAAASWDQYPNFEVRGDEFIDAVTQYAEKKG
ncbi:UDP-N-acetylmuramoyl-L-alanine--D-glutamate ligase [Lacticaseibacillus camelliae]|uniref:UDP-N-acetylmuramoylalanine--D-glutamate ligase n=1 Tax=Lacticaseibacillus camelliae DSM 22697 = JCM 13995 TaxID=1423730 RepID=A0A0R2FB22_9LACO|nr:UDP-N-acetylmuramoyl-L-alanine--D-glutamate ligase [Lacticaseibacillus camelliae]KRN25584.1 udp-n-acetylmuramoyl-l-alanyl-d-glutamate synthetase [Lacticaseibacillus camelliae DSM 22697 = JCM 13995]